MYDPLGINTEKKYDPLALNNEMPMKYDPLGLSVEAPKEESSRSFLSDIGSGMALDAQYQGMPSHENLKQSPNLYATVKTAEDMIPWAKYIDPEERDRFMKLSTNKQVRELLHEDLNYALGFIALPEIGKAIKPVLSSAFEKFLPKTYKYLSKEISFGKKAPIEQTRVEPTAESKIGEPELTAEQIKQRNMARTNEESLSAAQKQRNIQETLNKNIPKKIGNKYLDLLVPESPLETPSPVTLAGAQKAPGQVPGVTPKKLGEANTEAKMNKFWDDYGKKLQMEEGGKSSLQDIIDENISPQVIAKQFWDKTYFNLPAEIQRKFETQYKTFSGGTALKDIAPEEISAQLDMPTTAEHLEGTERGFVVLMHEANKRFNRPSKADLRRAFEEGKLTEKEFTEANQNLPAKPAPASVPEVTALKVAPEAAESPKVLGTEVAKPEATRHTMTDVEIDEFPDHVKSIQLVKSAQESGEHTFVYPDPETLAYTSDKTAPEGVKYFEVFPDGKVEVVTPAKKSVKPDLAKEVAGKTEGAIIAYHGTNADFPDFSKSLQYSRGRMGIHLGDKEAAGNIFGETPPKRIIPVDVDIKNPLRLEDLGSWQGADVVKMVNDKIGSKLHPSASDSTIREVIQKAGYDGVVYKNRFESNIEGIETDSYIAFSPKQIKIIAQKSPTPTVTSVGKQASPEPPTRDFLKKTGGKVGESGEIVISQGKTQAQAKLQPDTPAAKVEGMFDRTNKTLSDKEKLTFGKVRDAFTKAVVDTSGNLKRAVIKADPVLGKQVVMDRELLAGAVPKAADIIEKSRADIYGVLDSSEQELLNRVIQSRRTIAIDSYKTGVKHPEGLGGIEHQQYLDELAKNDPATFAKVNQSADNYFKVMRSQLDDLLKEGIITQEQFAKLSEHEYSPRQFMQHLDPMESYVMGGRRISVPDSGIKALDEGSLELLNNDSGRFLNEVVTRTQVRIFKNRATKSLWEMAQNVPDNPVVKPSKIVGTSKSGDPVFEKAPAGFDRVSFMLDGKKQDMIMPTKMAEEWVKSDPLINETLANIIGWASGATPLKAVATGYNPAFILGNMPRDLGLIWSATTEYSKHLPAAMAQMSKDLVTVAMDVAKRKGRVQDFIDEGGGMTFLTYYGRITGKGHVGEGINSLGNLMGWVGETSELWTRLALRERAILNGATPKEATWIARRYLDFSQGGNVAKGLDTGLPYLNASIQGTRGFLRGAKQNPTVFTYKMAQLGTVATLLYKANQLNPECWNQISDREKEANFIITTPFSYIDDKGQKRFYYGKIAKDQSQRVVTSLFDATMARYHEGKFPTKQMLMAFGDLASLPLPPTISAYLAYAANVDTWTSEDVWKGPKVNPQEEWQPGQTSKTMQAFGQKTGLSPERTKGAVNKIIPMNNPFVGLVGGGLSVITGEMEEDMKNKTMSQLLAENPSIRRVLASTNPFTQYREKLEQMRTDENTRRFIQKRDLDVMTEKFFRDNDNATKSEIYNYVMKQPEADREHLVNDIMERKKLDKIPDRSWWINIKSMTPEVRANAYWDRYKNASAEEQAQMAQIAKQINGLITDRFVSKLIELKKTKNK